MSLINREDLIAEYDRVHVGAPGGARKLMVDAPEVKPEPKWIPCSEKLPEYGVAVLVDSDCGIMIGYFDTSKLWFGLRPFMDSIELDVDAWMPLPEPYREEGD